MFKSYFESDRIKPFALAMAAEVDDLPPLVSPRDIDSYNLFGCKNPNSGAGSSAERPPMSPIDPSTEDVHILDLIKKLWTVNEGPVPNYQELKIQTAPKPEPTKQDVGLSNLPEMQTELPYDLKVTRGPYSCWDFVDMMPLQTARLKRASPFSFSGDADTTFSHSSSDDDIENQDEARTPRLIAETDQEKDIVRSIEMLISDAEAGEKLNQGDFEAYPLETTFIVDREVVFFIEEIEKNSRKNLIRKNIWKFKVELIRPDASMSQLTLLPDPMGTQQGRHFCSFYPAHTGPHLICVYVDVGCYSPDSNKEDFRQLLGSPFIIEAARCYSYSSSHSLSRSAELPSQQTTASTPFCLKAWGVSVYRPYNWIFVADRDSHEIVVLDSNCKILYKFGRKGPGPGEFFRPTGVSVDCVHKRVFITDKDNHRVSVFGLDGNFLFNFGQPGHRNGEFQYPWGVAVSPDGQFIAVADSRNHRIQLFSPTGIFLRKFSVFEARPFDYKQEFNFPRGIAFSLNGSHIYVTDFNLQTVFVINLALTEKKTLIHPGRINMNRPQGLTVDEAGNIIVADSKHDCIHVLSPTGNRICTLNKSGKNTLFDTPLDLAVLKGGRLVVVDQGNRLHIL